VIMTKKDRPRIRQLIHRPQNFRSRAGLLHCSTSLIRSKPFRTPPNTVKRIHKHSHSRQ
jgi:hypothetical protein